jgi:hypothetical protein
VPLPLILVLVLLLQASACMLDVLYIILSPSHLSCNTGLSPHSYCVLIPCRAYAFITALLQDHMKERLYKVQARKEAERQVTVITETVTLTIV